MRGVGQTTHLIYNLPNERCMIVTYQHDLVRQIEQRLQNLRGKDFAKQVKVVSISSSDDLNKLMGYSHLIYFDHAFFDFVEEEIARKALSYAQSAAIVYHNHKGNFK